MLHSPLAEAAANQDGLQSASSRRLVYSSYLTRKKRVYSLEFIVSALGLLALGFCTGIVSAGLGLGGGILMVPAFVGVLHLDPHTAKGTSLFIIIFVTALNAWRLNRNHPPISWRTASLLAAGSIIGAYLGVWVSAFFSPRIVLYVFTALIILLAFRTLFLPNPTIDQKTVKRANAYAILVGMTAGLVSGMTGTGGGAVLVPLTLLTRLTNNERAVALSNLVMVATSIAGSLAAFRAPAMSPDPYVIGQVNLALVPCVFLGAQLGFPPGKRLNAFLTLPRRRIVMGVLLLLIALRLLRTLST